VVGDDLPRSAKITATTTTTQARPAAATHREPNRERLEGGTDAKLPVRGLAAGFLAVFSEQIAGWDCRR
jgi:hypothetical protein